MCTTFPFKQTARKILYPNESKKRRLLYCMDFFNQNIDFSIYKC